MRIRVAPVVLGVTVVLLGSCKAFGTRIAKEDCERWTEHYRTVAREVLQGHFVKCGMDQADIDKGGKFIGESCLHNVGQSFTEKDAKCYLDGTSLEAWKTCGFGAATMFHGYENAIDAQRGFLEDLCAK